MLGFFISRLSSLVSWQDFDFDGKVKIPWGFYLVLIYLLRGYITWIFSLTYRNDPALILSLIYTESRYFYFALAIGLPAVLVQVLFALKKYKDHSWYQTLWPQTTWLLALTLLVDLVLQCKQIYLNHGLVHWFHISMLITGIYLLWYWLKSTKLKRFFQNWLL